MTRSTWRTYTLSCALFSFTVGPDDQGVPGADDVRVGLLTQRQHRSQVLLVLCPLLHSPSQS